MSRRFLDRMDSFGYPNCPILFSTMFKGLCLKDYQTISVAISKFTLLCNTLFAYPADFATKYQLSDYLYL